MRARLERDPDEDAAAGALSSIAKNELGPYLLESYWTSLDRLLRSLLTATSFTSLIDLTQKP